VDGDRAVIQIGPIVMPCCTCNVKPGEPCEWAAGPRNPGVDFHARRVRDAATARALITDPEPQIDHAQNEVAERALAKHAAGRVAKAKLIAETSASDCICSAKRLESGVHSVARAVRTPSKKVDPV
jgi:hypothetical protein